MVVKPNAKIGQYGGRWRSGLPGRSDTAWLGRTMGNDTLLRWAPDLKSVVPNVAQKWEVSPDGKEFTFYLRKGMKWSDGTPFTADDFVYWYEEVIMNDDLTKVKPSWFRTGGKIGKVVKVDDSTFKMIFELPNGLLIKNMNGAGMFWAPAEYMKTVSHQVQQRQGGTGVQGCENCKIGWHIGVGQKNDAWLNPGATQPLWPGK